MMNRKRGWSAAELSAVRASEETAVVLAQHYGCSASTIRSIRRNESYYDPAYNRSINSVPPSPRISNSFSIGETDLLETIVKAAMLRGTDTSYLVRSPHYASLLRKINRMAEKAEQKRRERETRNAAE